MKGAAVAICVVCLAVAGCKGNKALTKANFDKIEAGMSLADVQTLLGGLGEEDVELNLAQGSPVAGAVGVGGTLESMTPQRSSTKWYMWGNSSKFIKGAFVEGKVAPSNFKKASDNIR